MEKSNSQPAPQIPQVSLKRMIMPYGPATRFIYCLTNGQYLGTIEFVMVGDDQNLARAISQDFSNFVAHVSGGIVQAPADAVPGLRKPIL